MMRDFSRLIRMLPGPVALVFAALAAVSLFSPPRAAAFGEGGCGEGACSECHSFSVEEAQKVLTGLVEKVHSVEFSEVPGLYKVEAEAQGQRGSMYIDFSKAYIISGRVLRLSDWSDVTESSPQVEKKADLSKIPFAEALVVGSKNAPVRVGVFTDPQCPYCGKLHEEIKKVVAARPDTAFYLFLFPLQSHPDAHRISQSVLCENSLELLEKSFAKEPVPDPKCESDLVDRFLQSGREIGVRSTPTLVLPDGRVLPGFKPAEKLLEILESLSPPR